MGIEEAKDVLCKRMICIFEIQCGQEYATRRGCKNCPYFVPNKSVDNALRVVKGLFEETDKEDE